MQQKHLYILLILINWLLAANAQNRLRFDRLTVKEGLSHSTVHVVYQDQKGFIWIGTEDGLNIYNGYTFEVFKHDSNNPKSLSNSVVKSIHQDRKGTIWIGTEDGLNQFDPVQRNFQVHKVKPNRTDGLTSNHIRKILEDQHGHLWLATDNGVSKITAYTRDSIHCIQYPSEPLVPSQKSVIPYPITRGLFIDSKERIWVGTDGGGVCKIINGIAKKNPMPKFFYYKTDKNKHSIAHNRVNSFAEDQSGAIWMGIWGSGLVQYVIDTNGVERFNNYKHHPTKNSVNLDRVTTVYVDSKNQLWVGTYNAGINRVQLNQTNNQANNQANNQVVKPIDGNHQPYFESFVNDADNPYSLAHNTAYVFFEDRASELWIGTWGDGISKLTSLNNQIMSWGNLNGFEDPAFYEVWAVDFDPNDNWWIGAWDGGIAKLSAMDRTSDQLSYQRPISYFKHNPNDPNSLSDNKVTDILYDSKDRLWVATWSEYLNVAFNVSASATPQFKKIKVGDNGCFVYEDRSGVVWVGTQEGLFEIVGTEQSAFTTNTVQMNVYKSNDDNPRSLPFDRISTMLEDSKGNLWVGTVDGGLAVANRKAMQEFPSITDWQFDLYAHRDNDSTSLSHPYVLSILEASDGTIWIGTLGGLDQYDEATNSFIHYNEKTGHLLNNSVNGITEDKNGHLWLSTERGITQFDPRTKKVKHFNEEDGLQGQRFMSAATRTDAYGNLFFGGIEGLNAFHPSQILSNSYQPPVVLTDLKILNKSILNSSSSHHHLLDSAGISDLKTIRLHERDYMLTFEFAALNYISPSQNKYQYKLVGFDEDWNAIGNTRTATYTNLDAGKYQLLVKGANNDGIWNDQPLIIDVIVRPYYWKTWWFRSLIAGVVGLLLFFFINNRLKASERRAQELEEEVEIRTQEIKKQKRLVEERSKYKEQFFSNVSHELRTPLNGIIGLSHLMERTKQSEMQRQFTNVIKDSAENLLAIINDLLDISKMSAGKLELIPRAFETSRFFNSLHELLRPKAALKNLELKFNIDHQMPEYLYGDSVRLYQVLINLLGNALKFTAEGRVVMNVLVLNALENSSEDQESPAPIHLQIDVADTGIGIPEEKLANIFKTYEQVITTDGYHYEGSGLGLTVVKNLVDLQEGSIQVRSKVDRGTTFTVVLPFSTPTQDAIQKSIQKKQQTAFSTKWKDKIVLLIEDNQVNLLYAKNLFAQWNLNVAVAKSVSEAIHLLARTRYDAIVSDVRLPDGNGIDLVRRFQSDHKHLNQDTPVVILSANTSLSGARPNDIEVVDYLPKPFLPEHLADVLSKVFEESIGQPSAKADSQPSPILEGEYLAHLSKLMKGNKKNMAAMLELFLKQLPESAQKMDIAIETQEWETVSYEAHTLKSTTRTVGLFDLANILQEIENTAERERPNQIELFELYEQFQQKAKTELPRLEEELERLAAN